MKIKGWIAKDISPCFRGERAVCLFPEKPVLSDGYYRSSPKAPGGRTPMQDFQILLEPGECREVTIEIHEPSDNSVCPGCCGTMELMIAEDKSCVLGERCRGCGRQWWNQVPVPYTPPEEKSDVQN